MSSTVSSDQMAEIRALNASLLSTNDPRFPPDETGILQVETERLTLSELGVTRRPRPARAQAAGMASPRAIGLNQKFERSVSRLQEMLHRAMPVRPESFQEPRLSEMAVAREALERQDWPTAVVRFERVIARESSNADAWLGLAQAQHQEGNYSAAHASLDQVFHLRPTSNKGFMLRARVHRSEGDFIKAREYYWKLVAKNLTESPVLMEVLHEIEGMGLHRDTFLIAGAILDIDNTNETARDARNRAMTHGVV